MFSKNKCKLFFLTVLVITISGFLFWRYSGSKNKTAWIRVGEAVFQAEVAENDDSRYQGLSNRKEICEDCAMLFVFDRAGYYSFSMRKMNFPLDFVWIRNNQVVGISKNVAHDFSGSVNPPSDIDSVLEIRANTSEKFNLRIDDKVVK